MGKNGTGKKPPMGPTSDPALNAALRKVERDRIEIGCKVSDAILIIAGLRIACTHPTIAPLEAARRLEYIVDQLTAVVVNGRPELLAMFTDGDPFKT
jgi:hypothetical protein